LFANLERAAGRLSSWDEPPPRIMFARTAGWGVTEN
jgi:hypothetical protein